MNNARRKVIGNISDVLLDCVCAIEDVRDEEQEAYDNLSEGLQATEMGERMGNALAELESAILNIEDAMEALKNAAD